jgi:hypothetical protein
MKKILTTFLPLMLGIVLNAQIIKLDDVRKVKASKLIVALTGDEQINEALKSVVPKYWTFSEVVGFEDAESANKKAKEDDNLYVLSIGTKSSRSLTHSTAGSNIRYQFISEGKAINIGRGKGSPVIFNPIPSFEDDVITEEILIYGISTMQNMCKIMDEKNLSSNMKIKSAYKENTPELKNKVLYLAEGWLAPKLDVQKIPEMYDAKIKVVSYDDWRNAIISGEDGVAYCIVVPVATGGSYTYIHYLVDAKTSAIYAFTYPKVGMNVAGVNVSKSNTGYINSKNIGMYNDALYGKW